MNEILVIDDDIGPFRPGLEQALRGHRLHMAVSGEDGLRLLEKQRGISCVLLDVMMPAHFAANETREGIEVLKRIRQARPDLPIIMLTVLHDVELVVEAMKEGAFHYITKPIDRDRLRDAVARAIENRELKGRVDSLTRARDAVLKMQRGDPAARDSFHGMIGRHPLMRDLYSRIERVGQFDDMNVVILGETGSGKDLAARAIHESSPRAKGPYVAVNCGAVTETLLESELFGHEKGAFTGADMARPGVFVRADGGTLFMDEVGDMPPLLQTKLLRVLENKEVTPVGGAPKEVNVRIVCATHRDLSVLKEEGKFREDLYFRIWDVPISVPPLRQRLEDLPLLVEHFLGRIARQNNITCSIELEALDVMARHSWPGNVRELASVIRRLVVFAEGGRITAAETARLLGQPVPEEEAIPQNGDKGLQPLVRQFPEEAPPPRGTPLHSEVPEVALEYPEIPDPAEYRRVYGEIKLKEVVERAIREAGNVRAAMTLLAVPQDRYDLFRQWLHRLDIRVREITR